MRGMNIDVIFGIIIAVVILAFVLLFGSQQISSFFCLGGDAQTAAAVRDLLTETNDLYVLSQGSVKAVEVRIPADAKLCVVSLTSPAPDVSRGWDPPSSVQLILRTPEHEESRNPVWSKSCGSWHSAAAPRLTAPRSFCASGASSILLTNAGDHVTAAPG